MESDLLTEFKAIQKENWALFAPLETVTTISAATLVTFSDLTSNDSVFDVSCGTDVVAFTAARVGGTVTALDLNPILLEREGKEKIIN